MGIPRPHERPDLYDDFDPGSSKYSLKGRASIEAEIEKAAAISKARHAAAARTDDVDE